jgi:hypothetical protein
MTLYPSKSAVIISLALLAMQAASAAQQCLALPGKYGAVTVSGCENDTVNGVYNPVSSIIGAGYPYDGVALGELQNTLISCTYSFNHPVLASSITVDLDRIQPGDNFSVDIDGQSYAFTSADIVQSPLPSDSSSPFLIGTDTLNQQSGVIALPAGAPITSSGSAKVKVSAGQWISSLKLNMQVTEGNGGVTRVCIDDAAQTPPSSPVATPVPMGLATTSAASVGVLIFAAFLARRRKSSS